MIVTDTNVVSYIFSEHELAAWYLPEIESQRALISFATLEELWFGAYNGNWGDRRKNELARHLEQYEVIWPDAELVEICARLRSHRKADGREMSTGDAWIAATALRLNCPLVSHDRDFEEIEGLELISFHSTSR